MTQSDGKQPRRQTTDPNNEPTDTRTREDRIRLVAYATAERRSFEPGFETQDWLDAKRQIDAQDAERER